MFSMESVGRMRSRSAPLRRRSRWGVRVGGIAFALRGIDPAQSVADIPGLNLHQSRVQPDVRIQRAVIVIAIRAVLVVRMVMIVLFAFMVMMVMLRSLMNPPPPQEIVEKFFSNQK